MKEQGDMNSVICDAEEANAESRFDGLKINQTYAIKSSARRRKQYEYRLTRL